MKPLAAELYRVDCVCLDQGACFIAKHRALLQYERCPPVLSPFNALFRLSPSNAHSSAATPVGSSL